jgi:hypothetical protein
MKRNYTLTQDRVFEAAPFSEWERVALKRWRKEEEGKPSFVWSWIVRHSFRQLLDRYWREVSEIGEERAFWGLVYRLLDDPTEDDVELIRALIVSYGNVFYK